MSASVDHLRADPNAPLPDETTAFGLEPRAIRAAIRDDLDIGRIYRMTSMAAAATSGIAIYDASTKPGLQFRQRALGIATASTYLGLGIFGAAIAPSRMAHWLERRPRRSMAVSLVPLGLIAFSGGAKSPLTRLATIGVATGAGIRDIKRDAQLHGLLGGLGWSAAALVSRDSPRLPLEEHVTVWVGFVLAARLAATASWVAYDNRNMFDQLAEFTSERDELQPYVDELTAALAGARAALLDSARATPAEGVDSEELFELVVTALGRLEERRGVLDVAGLSTFDIQSLVDLVRPTFSRPDSFPDLTPKSSRRASELRALLHERATLFTALCRVAPRVEVAVSDSIEVRGLRRLALIGAAVTTATTNAIRHAPHLTFIRVTLTETGNRLELEILNDGTCATEPHLDPSRPRSGLTHLRYQLESFGGTLSLQKDGAANSCVRAVLPALSEYDQTEFWSEDIREQISTAITSGTRLAAVKSALTALKRPAQAGVRGDIACLSDAQLSAPWVACAHALLPLAAETLEASGHLRGEGSDREARILVLAAAFNAYCVRRGLGLSTTWVNGFASRYAFDASPDAWAGWRIDLIAKALGSRTQQRAYFFTALNLLAIQTSRTSGGRTWADRLVSLGLGPSLLCGVINPAQPRTRLIDNACNDRLSELESLHGLANSFHAEHAAPPKIHAVADSVADDALRGRLLASLDAISAAEDALEFPEPGRGGPQVVSTGEPLDRILRFIGRSRRTPGRPRVADVSSIPARSLQRPTIGAPDGIRLGEYLAMALARRVWPARVRLEFDYHTLDYAPPAAIGSAQFRHQAAAAMDLLGRKLTAQFGRHWDGMWSLRQVDLAIAVIPWTGTLECNLVAWAPRPTRTRQYVDALHDMFGDTRVWRFFDDRDPDYEERLTDADASLIHWKVYDVVDLDDVELRLPAKRRRKPAVRRAEAVLQLHPERHSPKLVRRPRV